MKKKSKYLVLITILMCVVMFATPFSAFAATTTVTNTNYSIVSGAVLNNTSNYITAYFGCPTLLNLNINATVYTNKIQLYGSCGLYNGDTRMSAHVVLNYKSNGQWLPVSDWLFTGGSSQTFTFDYPSWVVDSGAPLQLSVVHWGNSGSGTSTIEIVW